MHIHIYNQIDLIMFPTFRKRKNLAAAAKATPSAMKSVIQHHNNPQDNGGFIDEVIRSRSSNEVAVAEANNGWTTQTLREENIEC